MIDKEIIEESSRRRFNELYEDWNSSQIKIGDEQNTDKNNRRKVL